MLNVILVHSGCYLDFQVSSSQLKSLVISNSTAGRRRQTKSIRLYFEAKVVTTFIVHYTFVKFSVVYAFILCQHLV